MCKRFYITTAIDYVNGQPHLGHAYEKVITDVIARAQRALGRETFFLTGLDEHGQKVQQAAQAEGRDPQAYCDELAAVWQSFAVKLGLAHNDFIRTTQARHKTVVQAMLTKLRDQGELYKAPYRGWYSWKEETFLTDKDRQPDGTFDPVWGSVTELVEDNWFFRMSRHQRWLIEYLEAHPAFVQPDYRRNEVLGFLRHETLADLCISRPAARLSWGIPIPFAPEWVNYVWFDALTNYYSVPAAAGDPVALEPLRGYLDLPATDCRLWPADIHVIGKDILKFHAVYWPIMLHAVGAPLPQQVLVHGWWQKDDEKMSKSIGNVVEPGAVIDAWGLDAFRYYVVRELDIGSDGNWTDAGFAARYDAELANGLGNLVHRSLSMLKRYRGGIVPPRSDALAGEVHAAAETITALLSQGRLQAGLKTIWNLISRANQYVDHTAPFKLAKDPSQASRLDAVLYTLAETCRVLGVLLLPYLPDTAHKLFGQLGLAHPPDRIAAAAWGGLSPGQALGDITPLFPRREVRADR
ncbi:MAG: methionine--tRNA ligase [Verrucomicrobia bacterium]|nr:methionine--tRNA ligase [Verrucomicrobiota bacterium]